MRSSKYLLLFCGLILVASCAMTRNSGDTGMAGSQYSFEKILPYPQDVTWSAILDIVNDRMWRAENINEPNGRILIAGFGIDGGKDMCECATDGAGPFDDHKARLDIKVGYVTANGTKVSIATAIDAHDGSGRYSKRVTCSSTGKLEQDFVAAIDSVIAGRQMTE